VDKAGVPLLLEGPEVVTVVQGDAYEDRLVRIMDTNEMLAEPRYVRCKKKAKELLMLGNPIPCSRLSSCSSCSGKNIIITFHPPPSHPPSLPPSSLLLPLGTSLSPTTPPA